MKKTLVLLFTIASLKIFSQGLTVSTGTPQQLSDKIINSKCVTTSNWSVSSGSNFGNSNSVGTFNRPAGVNFPFSNGVVLSTGYINSIPGPKLLPNYIGDGTNAWPGDSDMNSIVGSTNFTNASSLEFNFTSQLTTFKLNYVFASEEYGSNQCDLTASDAMVILLYDLTTGAAPINIATTATTNQIVSVNTIRENTYNTSCSDANASLFGAFYDAPNNLTAPINFFGRTVSMTASATIDPTHTYRVKIVIADRNDIQYDSAVFIEQYVPQYQAQNILGNDMTVANNNAQCEGTSLTLNTGLSAANTYLWRKDGAAIAGANGPSYTIPAGEAIGTHTYNVVYTFNTCNTPDGFFDSVTVEFVPPVTTPNPNNIFRCVGDTTPYNLFQNTPVVSAGLSYTPIVSYHPSQLAAENNTNPLPQNYNGPLTTIFIRIAQPGNPCPAIKQFTLGTTNPPGAIVTPAPLELCSRTPTILNAITNLSSLDTGILNGQSPSTYGVSYHNSQLGADTNTDAIQLDGSGLAIIPTTLTTIYVRVYVIGSQNCYVTTSFPVTISPLLGVDKPENVVYCGTPGYTLPPLTNGKYFTNPYDGVNPNSQLPEIPAGTLISIPSGFVGTFTQTVYISNLVTAANPCTEEFPLQITLIQPTSFTETDNTVCDNYTLPALQFGSYWTGPNGTGTEIPGGTTLTTTTTVYFNFQSIIDTPLNPSCNVPAGPVTITIEYKPDLGPDRQNVFTCNPPYILPPLNAIYPGAKYYPSPGGTGTPIPEGTPINTSQDIYVYIEDTVGTLHCPNEDYFRVVVGLDPIANINQCTYVLPQPSAGNYYSLPGGNGIQYPVGYNVEQSMTVYLYVEPPVGETCATGQNETSFTITVTHPPVDPIPGFATPNCGDFTLPLLTNGKYYTESHLNGGTGGTEIPAGYVVNSNQTIYVYNFTPGSVPLCDFEVKYDFVINPIPPIDLSVNTLIDLCNITSYTLPPLTDGNYFTGVGGTGQLLNTPELRVINGPFPVTLYIYNIDTTTGCENERSIRITSSTTVADDPVNPIEESCSTFNLPDLVVPGSRYHRSYWDPTDPNNISSTPPSGIVIPDPSVWAMPDPTQPYYDHTIYIYNSTLDGIRETCPINKPIRIILYRQPNITKPGDVYLCGSDYVLPTLPAGQKYYKESHLAGGTVFTELTGTISESQRIYIYEENNSILPNSTFKCYDEEFFDVFIFKIDTGTNLSDCGTLTLPTLTSGAYYELSGGVSPLASNTITNNTTALITKTIYIYGATGYPAGECQFLENSFQVTVNPIPTSTSIPLYDANPSVIDRTYCDTDTTNDGVLNIDLTQYSATILGTQTSSEFSVTYHNSESDALANLNPITESLSNNPTLYAVVRNSNFQTCSSVPVKIDFVINKLPEPMPEDQFLCMNNITGLPISYVTLDAGLYGNYIYEWKDENGVVVGNSNPLYSTNVLGDYTLTVTDADPTKGCVSTIKTVSVLPSSIAITGYTVSQDFDDNQIITVIPSGLGENYIYQIDGGLFQESNIFTNVPSGNHQIIIRDKNGCGDSEPINVLVLKYPKFFTPNGDGYNDYWNIFDLDELGDPNAKISIFDRQGKLLKQISPSGQGWDGMHNGKQMLADDYWFVVNYTRDSISREFKAHFSLKR